VKRGEERISLTEAANTLVVLAYTFSENALRLPASGCRNDHAGDDAHAKCEHHKSDHRYGIKQAGRYTRILPSPATILAAESRV